MTPTARSLKFLRDQGWIADRVEQRLHMPKSPFPITRDVFGFGDILAAHPTSGTIALIQSTSGPSNSNMNARIVKITKTRPVKSGQRHIPALARQWLMSGGKIFVHGWGKRGPRGERKIWQVSERQIVLNGGTFYSCDLGTFWQSGEPVPASTPKKR